MKGMETHSIWNDICLDRLVSLQCIDISISPMQIISSDLH